MSASSRRNHRGSNSAGHARGYYNIEKMISDLVAKGVEVQCCGTCLKARGITDTEMVTGAKRGTMMILAKWVKESDRVVSF
jgi:uncharacterized protein involved in oxidation of intracellular sulfur